MARKKLSKVQQTVVDTLAKGYTLRIASTRAIWFVDKDENAKNWIIKYTTFCFLQRAGYLMEVNSKTKAYREYVLNNNLFIYQYSETQQK